MAKPLIKGTPMYINPYEAAYDKLKDKTIFNQYDWNYALRNSEEDLQTYIGILTDSDKLSYDQLNQKYLGLIERMDTDQRLFMYQNELYGDKSDESRKAREIIVDYDADGNPIKESVEMTDYEYNSKMLEDWAKYQNELDVQRLKQYEKDNANFGEWLLYSAGTVGSVLLERPTKGAVDIIGSFFDLVDAIPAAIFTEDTFRERMSDDSIFGIDYWKFSDDWEKNFVDWASTNTWLYDTKGQANWVANIAMSTAYSIGQMAPSIAIGYLTGGLGTAVGLSSTAIQWTSAIAQQGFYYAGMASQNLRESFKAAGTDVSTFRVLSKVALQTGLDYIVEQCSAKMFGASMMDELVLGMTRRGSNGNAVLNVFKEALIEGAEETVQEFTSWFAANIHAGFDENDPLYQAFDLQTMVDAFICGALSSIALGASNTIVEQISKNKYMNELTKDDVVYLELIKSDKSKAKDYKHGLYAFMEDYGNVIQNIKNNPPKNSKQMQLAMELTQNMYTSYNTLMAIFEEYGGEKVKNAEMYLSKLNEIANRTAKKATEVDKTDFKTNMENFAKLLVENVQDQTIVQKVVSEIQKNVKDSKITRKELGQAVSVYLKNKQEFANSKQSEKAINTAKKLAAEGKDIVLTDTSATILEFGDVIFVPLPDIENLEADEILKAAETRTIVNTLIEQMPKNVLDFIVDKYKTTINSKTNETSTDTVRAVYNMLFNQSFYNILLQTADVDSINLITMLDNVVSTIAESTKNVDPYKNIINNVRKTMGASIVYYLCNNTNIDLASITVLNDTQKKFVYEHRYNSMLAERVINDVDVTEQDLNVIKNRINALMITKKEKERLYNNITSDKLSQRRHGIAELDDAYNGAFKGKYNDKIYMSGTDNKSALFNEFARLNGIDLAFFKGTKTNSDLEAVVKEKYGAYNYTNKIKYLKEKFELFTNNNYTLDVVGTNKDVVISEKDDAGLLNKFSTGEGLRVSDIKTNDSMDRTYFRQSTDDTGVRDIYNNILSNSITDFEKAYLSIDTIVSNPNKYLSDDIKKKISEQYGAINRVNAYSYLAKYIATNVDGYGLTILDDGRIIVADYGNVKSFLKNDILNADKTKYTLFEKFKKDGDKGIPITEFINEELLTPELKKIVVYVTESKYRNTSFNFAQGKNFIVINQYGSLKFNNALFRNAIMHEFNHALQRYNRIAEGGIDDNYKIEDNVIADFKKHVPQLFEKIKTKATTAKGISSAIHNAEINRIKDFIYYNSVGELESVGKNVDIVDIYPIVIKTVGNTSKVTMPWGSTYTFSGTGANRTLKARYTDVDKLKKYISKVDKSVLTENEYLTLIKNDPDAKNEYYPVDSIRGKYDEKIYKTDLVDTLNNRGESYSVFSKDVLDDFKKLPTEELFKYGDDLYKSIMIDYEVVMQDIGISEGKYGQVGALSERKKAILSKITPEKTTVMLQAIWANNYRFMSYDEFLNTDLPWVRIQDVSYIIDDGTFVSVSLQPKLTHMATRWGRTDNKQRYVFNGTVKPKDLLGGIVNDQFEVLLPSNKAPKLPGKPYKLIHNTAIVSDDYEPIVDVNKLSSDVRKFISNNSVNLNEILAKQGHVSAIIPYEFWLEMWLKHITNWHSNFYYDKQAYFSKVNEYLRTIKDKRIRQINEFAYKDVFEIRLAPKKSNIVEVKLGKGQNFWNEIVNFGVYNTLYEADMLNYNYEIEVSDYDGRRYRFKSFEDFDNVTNEIRINNDMMFKETWKAKYSDNYKRIGKVTKEQFDKATDYNTTIKSAINIVKNAETLDDIETKVRNKLSELGLVKQELDRLTEKIVNHMYTVGSDDVYQNNNRIIRKYNRDLEDRKKREISKHERRVNLGVFDYKSVTKVLINDIGKDTALEYYSPNKHEYNRKLTTRMITFLSTLSNSDMLKLAEIDDKFAEKIKAGKATQNTVYEFIRDYGEFKDMPDWLFNKIKSAFFPKSPFKSYQQVQTFLAADLSLFWATAIELRKNGLVDFLDFNIPDNLRTKKDYKNFLNLLIAKVPNIKQKIVKKASTFETMGIKTKEDGTIDTSNAINLNIDYSQGTLSALKYYDGTIDGAAHAAFIMRKIAMYGYNSKTAVKTVSADAKISADEDDDFYSILEDKTSGKNFDDKLFMKNLRDSLITSFQNRLYDFAEIYERNGNKLTKEAATIFREICSLRNTKFTSLSKQEQIEYMEKQLVKIINNKRQLVASKVDKFVKRYTVKINDVSNDAIMNLAAKVEFALDANLREIIYTKSNTINAKLPPRRPIYNKLKVRIKTSLVGKHGIDKVRFKNMPEDFKKYYTETKSGNRYVYDFKWDLIYGKNSSELTDLKNKLDKYFDLLNIGAYDNKKSSTVAKRLEKAQQENIELQNKLLTEQSKVKRKYKLSKNTTFEMHSDVEMPSRIESIMNTTFDDDATSTTKFLTKPDERHMVTSATKFFEQNAKELDALTSEEVEKAIDFFENAVFNPNASKEDMVRYESFKTMLFAYWIGKAEEGSLELKSTSVERMRSMLRKDVEVAATKLTTWRDVLKRIDPERLIRKSLAKYFGIELDDEDLDDLSTAIASNDMDTIKKAYSELYKKMLSKYKGNMTGAKRAMSAIFKIQKASMLSSPSTWARAWESNAIVTGVNAVSDWIGKILTKGIKRKGQYNLVGVKISDNTKNFVNEAFFKSGFYDMINEGLTRYDGRSDDVKISSKDKNNDIVRMMTNNIAISLSRNYVLGGKADKFVNLVFKMQSDDPFIKRSFARYLGKIIESQKIDITKGFTPEILNAASAAYTQAAYDYVHRNNFMSKLEKWMRTENPKMYMGYKLIMPFASSGWNWFMEALDLTPVQLMNNCLKLIKMEKLIEDAENKRQKGDFSGVDPRFMEFVTRRKIGKGVIGTALFTFGIILGMAGVIDIDDDDDKLKLRVFDYYVDISKTFGSSALLLGAAFTNPSKGSWLDAFESACNLTFEDSVLTTVMDTFRYDNTPYAYLTKLPGNVIMGFIPNLWKSVVRMINYKKIKYDNNFMGTLQYYIYSIVPGIYKSDWFEKQIDPFTGEEEVRYSNNFLVRLLNTVSPYTIKDYKPSDIELAFMSLGMKKGNLKGVYEDIGKLDYDTLNRKYGELNYKIISDLLNDKTSCKVKNKDGKYVELKWSKMNSEQKESALTSITSKNASYAKIFTWTDSGHKYYCSSNERLELAKLGITKNIYIGKDKQFVK